MLNIATKTSWIGRLGIGAMGVVATVIVAVPAQASTTTCPFSVANEVCAPIAEAWPADSAPTFALYCFSCSLDPPDAAPLPCSEVIVDPSQFWLEVDGVRLHGGTFETTSITCPVPWQVGSKFPGKVFRYTGPLRPGAVHKVHHSRSSYQSNKYVGSFTVAAEKKDSGVPPLSVDPSKNIDASPNTQDPFTDSSGCRIGGGRSSSAAPMISLLIGVLAVYGWRRRR